MEPQEFRYAGRIRVRNYEIDWQGIVHNANYLLYFETCRLEYLEQLGVRIDLHTVQHESKVVVVRNELDYRSPARFGEVLRVHTRIAAIRTSSFIFEGLMEEETTGRRIAENVSIHVWLDHRTDIPRPVPDEFRRLVHRFEGDRVRIDRPGFIA
jgi:acyl-CoA thioester hydrolase